MLATILTSKIHRATVTGADVDYEGSISIDSELMERAGIAPYEQVHVADVTNGERLVTYAIHAPGGSREVVINGAAARLVKKGDIVIIMAYRLVESEALSGLTPAVVRLGEGNIILGDNGGREGC